MPAPVAKRFVVLDCAVDPSLYAHVKRLEPRAGRCLFAGDIHPEVKKVSPHLLELTPDDPLVPLWRGQGWGKAWGMWITSSADLYTVWSRLRHFTQVKLPSGEGPVLFRFWDPRVFRVYMPLVEGPDVEGWFKGIDAYVVEAEDAKGSIRFTAAGGAVKVETAPMAVV